MAKGSSRFGCEQMRICVACNLRAVKWYRAQLLPPKPEKTLDELDDDMPF